MEAKFKIGDKVHVFPDTSTIYVVQNVKEISVAFFYDLKSESQPLVDVSEMNLLPV